jgi:molybdopterin-binding protein
MILQRDGSGWYGAPEGQSKGSWKAAPSNTVRRVLIGRIVDVRVSGLVAQATLSVGGQLITSLITSGAVREMREMQFKEGTNGQTAAALIKATEVMIVRV